MNERPIRKIIFALICILIFLSKDEGHAESTNSPVDQTEIISKYLDIWERLFKERNHLSDAEFEKYISYRIDAGQRRVFTHSQGNYGKFYNDTLDHYCPVVN